MIDLAVANNRELKGLNEDVQIASNEVLARSGQYLPFVSLGAGAGLDRASRYTEVGTGLIDDPFLPGKFFSNPHGNFQTGLNFTWQLDIYRQLRNSRDAAAQRYIVATERRNYFVTQLAADVAQNYYRLMALDKRLENLNLTIELQQRSYEIAYSRFINARGNKLDVLRFQADVRRNQSEKLPVNQDIVVTENRINFLVNRYPQPVERMSAGFYELNLNPLSVGVPSQLLQNRPDIRQAERDLAAAGLDVQVARVNFYPQLVLNAGTGLEAFNLRYLFEPQAVVGNLMGGLVGPLVNRRAIRAQYLTANARQLQTIYNYQRVILEAFTQVTNRLSMVQKYTSSLEIRRQQLDALENAVGVATNLFQNAQGEYLEVLLTQRDLRDARATLIEIKLEQLNAIVDTYQALGGGMVSAPSAAGVPGQNPYIHTVREGETFQTIAQLYYESERYYKALWDFNKKTVPDLDGLTVGNKIIIPRADQLDQALIEAGVAPAPTAPVPVPVPGDEKANPSPLPLPPATNTPGPFGQRETPDPAVRATGGTKTPQAAPKSATTRE